MLVRVAGEVKDVARLSRAPSALVIGPARYKCDVCSYSTVTLGWLTRHRQLHDGIRQSRRSARWDDSEVRPCIYLDLALSLSDESHSRCIPRAVTLFRSFSPAPRSLSLFSLGSLLLVGATVV